MDDFLEDWLTEEPTSIQPQPVGEVLPKLTSAEVRILNYCEQVYWETGQLPTSEKIKEDLNLSSRSAFNNETFRNQLAARGIDPVGEVLPKLTSAEVRILNYCEQVYWETGQLPTSEKIKEDLNLSSRSAFNNETFRNQLAARGIDPVGLVQVGHVVQTSKALSAKQIVCANMMLNLHDKRSQREKLALIDVSSQQFHAWLRQPQFQEFMAKRSEALFSSTDWQAYKSLITNVQSGDTKSLELFFRMRGIYNPTLQVNLNIDSVLQQVVTVVTKYVKDPLVLQAIAGELENIVDAEEVA